MSMQENPVTEKNEVDKIMEYILNTPENTNPAILRGMLENLSSEGGGGGESDFSTAEIRIINNSSSDVEFLCVNITEEDGLNTTFVATINSDKTRTLVLYMDNGLLSLYDDYPVAISTTGDISYDDGSFTVTGDGTVTITNVA